MVGGRLTMITAAVAWTKSNNCLRLPRVADPPTSDLPPEEEEVEAGEETGEVDNGRDGDHVLCCSPPECAATLTADVVIDARTFNGLQAAVAALDGFVLITSSNNGNKCLNVWAAAYENLLAWATMAVNSTMVREQTELCDST